MIGGGNGGKVARPQMPAGFLRKIDFHCAVGRWGAPAKPNLGENGGENDGKTVGNGGKRRASHRPPRPKVFPKFSTAFPPSFPRFFN